MKGFGCAEPRGELLRSYRRPRVHQDLGYEILGLKQLYDVNYRWLPKFEEEAISKGKCQ